MKTTLALILLILAATSSQASEPPIPIRSVLDARPAERQRLFALIARRRPAALVTLAPAVAPPANRPTVTPGNTHGQRPTVPPGIIRNYATP